MSNWIPRITAMMDQERAALGDIGPKEQLSGMELLVLCTAAELGLMMLIAKTGAPINRDKAAQAIEMMTAMIRRELRPDDPPAGQRRFVTSLASLLRGERLNKYIMEPGDGGNEGPTL